MKVRTKIRKVDERRNRKIKEKDKTKQNKTKFKKNI